LPDSPTATVPKCQEPQLIDKAAAGKKIYKIILGGGLSQADQTYGIARKTATMGVGRRMQKQGAPEPLSEEHFANLKRKKGLPVDDVPAEARSSKRRRASKTIKPLKGKKAATSANALAAATKPTGKATAGAKNGKSASLKSKKGAPLAADSDEEMDDEFDIADLDGLDDSEIPKLGDDFMDSGSSVYDSDEGGKKEKFVFSDDEDEDEEEREEKLTAANIEGLSRKLDQEREDEAAENEAELRQDALQTNIEGDKPHVLSDDDDDDDELSAKTKGLLAPDLQMLRTRITETIRVLEDFGNLAEQGRSRVEYTDQMLKDFCACMRSVTRSPILCPR